MKCPECDAEQPDNASLCAKCGLSFLAWREANPESAKKGPVPEPEMTFPVPEEDKPAPMSKGEITPEKKPTPEKAEPHSEHKTAEAPQASSVEELAPSDKKSFKWTPLYSAGVGVFGVMVLAVLFFTHHSSKQTSSPAEGNILPIGTLTPTISSTLGTETPIASPQATGTPENSLLLNTPTPLSQASPLKAHSEKPVSTPTSTADNIIQPEETLSTPTPKPASAPNSQNEGQELSAPISKEQKIGTTPTEVPVSAIWADSPTPSPESNSPVPATDATASTAATPAATAISSPSDILESPEPKNTATPSSTP